jgi:hypothetical protein
MKVRSQISNLFYKLHILFAEKEPEIFVPKEDDTYLVSYPRSGSTWLRVLLAEYMYSSSGTNLEELQHYIPDIHVRTHVNEIVSSDFHVVKSHEKYCSAPNIMEKYKRVVYLIRDPRDVILSHYRYHKQLKDFVYDIDEFLNEWLNGRVWPCSWQEHVNSWTTDRRQHNDYEMLILRYEDFFLDVAIQLRKVLNFLQLELNDSKVKAAVYAGSPARMRLKEIRGMPAHERAEDLRFIGRAKPEQWKEYLKENQLKLINEYAGEVMKRFDYI